MARYFSNNARPDEGSLILSDLPSGCIEVHYQPSLARIKAADGDTKNPQQYKRRLLCIDPRFGYICIYPISTYPNARFMEPKYSSVESITVTANITAPASEREVQSILEDLPDGFVKDFDYGLGLRKEYRHIVLALSSFGEIRHLVVDEEQDDCRASGSTYLLPLRRFDTLRRAFNRIANTKQQSASAEKLVFAYNSLVHQLDPSEHPLRHLPYERDAVYRLVTDTDTPGASLSENDKGSAVKLVSDQLRNIAGSKAEALLRLRADIELVALEDLVEKMEEMLEKELSETKWQAFLRDNAFVLGLAFGVPVVLVDDQVSVGGKAISGKGEKVTDFLVKNPNTHNAVLIEIKAPNTELLGKEYRRGVFPPSTDLSGGVSQLLDQRGKFLENFPLLARYSEGLRLETHSVECILIIGKTPADTAKQRSFEIFRNNFRAVTVVTFDELLEKLRTLRDFLRDDI